jgi:hypothetical protein
VNLINLSTYMYICLYINRGCIDSRNNYSFSNLTSFSLLTISLLWKPS